MTRKGSPRRRDEAASGDKGAKGNKPHLTEAHSQAQAVTALRLALLANGYAPLPAKGKEVHLEGWTSLEPTEEMIRGWLQNAKWASYTNTGILTRDTPAIDIDIKDVSAAEALEALVRKHFSNGGRLLRRIGMPPKRAFLFKTDAPFTKLLEKFIPPDGGDEHKIEILGDGQQVVVDGIHPDTQQPYTWHGGEPWTVNRDELVTLTAAAARAWLDEATALLVGMGWGHVAKSQTTDTDGDGGDFPLIVKLGLQLRGGNSKVCNDGHGQFRIGTHGSLHIDANTRTWFDFEANDGGGIKDLMRRVMEAGGKDETAVKQLNIINISTWDDEPVPQQDYSVPDRIPVGHTTMLSGEGGGGKSIIFLQLAIAHALGGRGWLRSFPKSGPALFIDAEDGQNIMHKRSVDIVNHYGARFADLTGKLHLISRAAEDAILATFSRRSGRIEPTALYRELLEMAGDLKPVNIGIASSANVYAGNEIDRSQVMQFVTLLNKIAVVANSGLVLISHPSLTGIASESGLSGSTQWHNSTRARAFLKGYKQEGTQDITANTKRELAFMKNQYGPLSSSVILEYRNGLFLPVEGTANANAAEKAERAKDVFLILLKRFNEQNRNVSANPGKNYAPSLFIKEQETIKAALSKFDLEKAMRELLNSNQIIQRDYGRPSRSHYRLVINDNPGQAPPEEVM